MGPQRRAPPLWLGVSSICKASPNTVPAYCCEGRSSTLTTVLENNSAQPQNLLKFLRIISSSGSREEKIQKYVYRSDCPCWDSISAGSHICLG